MAQKMKRLVWLSEGETGSDCSEGRKGSEQSVESSEAFDLAEIELDGGVTAEVDNSAEFEVEGDELSELDVGVHVGRGVLSDEVPVEDARAVVFATDE
jgi:hypothetical protein